MYKYVPVKDIDDDLKRRLARNLRRLRLGQGLSQYAVEDCLGEHRYTYQRLEYGVHLPEPPLSHKLADLCGISHEELYAEQ